MSDRDFVRDDKLMKWEIYPPREGHPQWAARSYRYGSPPVQVEGASRDEAITLLRAYAASHRPKLTRQNRTTMVLLGGLAVIVGAVSAIFNKGRVRVASGALALSAAVIENNLSDVKPEEKGYSS